MDWLLAQAQGASPFVASFCLLSLGCTVAVIKVLWKQINFERAEHRRSEEATTGAINKVATSLESLATRIHIIDEIKHARRKGK